MTGRNFIDAEPICAQVCCLFRECLESVLIRMLPGKKDWEYDTGTQTASGADHNPGTPYDAATQDNAVIPRSIGGVPGNIETRMIRGQTSSTQNTKDSSTNLLTCLSKRGLTIHRVQTSS